AKSAGGSSLAGTAIEVCDEAGEVLARGELNDTPWPGTDALYWTEVALRAPATAGLRIWSVKFAAAGLELPHDASSASFSIAVVDPPEHRLTVKVVAKETQAPIEDAVVCLGAYRASTGPFGVAEVMMPKGTYS